MCRSTDTNLDGILPRGRNCLKIKAFFVRLKGFKSCKLLPPALSLLYLPRINGSELFVNGSKVRPDSTAFLTLHRAVNVKTKEGEAIFGSREQVWASEGVRFEVYSGDERALEGIFRKDEEDEWNLECKCGLDHEVVHGGATEVAVAEEADVCVALEGHVALGGRVEMVSRRKKNRRIGFDRLEVIPEERENGVDESVNGCRDDCKYRESDGGGLEKSCESDYDLMEMDLEGVRWAVHVGLWVMCFGVGYLVSKASARSLRRLRLL